MNVPDQAGQLGGTFACPSCRAVNMVAPVATSVASAPVKPADKRGPLLLGAILFLGLLFIAVPVPGAVIGAAILVWGAVSVAKGLLSPLQLLFRESTKKTAMAVGSAFIGIFFVTCSGMGFNGAARTEARLAKEAEQKAEAEAKRKAEIAERQEQARDALGKADEALARGDVETAQALLAQARELVPDIEGADELGQAVKDELHRRALATMPDRLTKIREHTSKEAWRDAGKECHAAKAIETNYDGLADACAPVEHQLVRLKREQAVQDALDVANNRDQCETPLSISEAWNALREIPSDDPSFKGAKRAAARLEKCRKKAERAFDRGLRDVMKAQRERYVENLDRVMLETGVDAVVTAHGKYKDRLKIKWVLMGRAMAHQMANDAGIVAAAEKIGFTRVTFSDGFYESFHYDLEPQSEAGGGKAVLEGMGLAEPLRL